MRTRQQIKQHLINRLGVLIKDDDILLKQLELTEIQNIVDDQGNLITKTIVVGRIIQSVPIESFIDYFEDILKDDTGGKDLLTDMEDKKFYHPVTFMEVDVGYKRFLTKWKIDGIIL